jgi:hypothetical protein
MKCYKKYIKIESLSEIISVVDPDTGGSVIN